jgi:hypothetical protein
LVWRNGKGAVNTFSLANYPIGYYAGGDFNKHCEIIKEEEMNFCEDVIFWDLLNGAGKLEERKVLVSCDPHRKGWNTVMGPLRNPNPRGALWVHSPSKGAKARPQRLTLKGYPAGHDFHPLGLDIYPSYAGNSSNLFVINHARERTVIEQFTLSPSSPTTAIWVRTLSHKYFISPNSLALTSPTSFYVSNDHLMTRRLPNPLGHILPMVETLLFLPLSWLAHVSLESDPASSTPTLKHTLVDFGVAFANGVALSPDGKQVALASTTLSQIQFYSRDPSTNSITNTHTVPLPFNVDNISFDDDGSLIVAGHPHFPSLIGVAANKTGAVSPSWVMAISPRAKAEQEVGSPSLGLPPKEYDLQAPISAASRVPAALSHEAQTLFQSNGTGFSSSSTGLRDAKTGALYVTGLYEDGLLVCRAGR